MGPSYLRAALAALGLACMLAAPAAAQYVNVNDDLSAMARRSLSQDALQSHNGAGGGGNGPEVDLQIVFPTAQTGISNIMVTMLEPLDAGAHECEAIAVKNGTNVISASFIPKKDVRPGHVYDVVVSDSMGDKYAVGRIRVGAGSPQAYRINAPLLTPSSPTYAPPKISAYSPAPSAQAQPAQAQTTATDPFARAVFSQAVPAPLLGLRGTTVTPQLLALAGAKSRSFRGVVVSDVENGGLAARAGLRPGDVIYAAGGRPCASMQQLIAVTQDPRGPAQAIDLTFLRSQGNGRTAVLHAKVPSARMVSLAEALLSASVPVPSLGMRGVTVTPSLLALAGAQTRSFQGVGVFDVARGSLAQRAGLGGGDFVVAVDGRRCATVQQLIALTGQLGGQGQPVDLTVVRHNPAGGLQARHVEIAFAPAPIAMTPYSPPSVGPGLVQPTTGPGFVPPSVGPGLVQPTTGPGLVQPTDGPGYIPPGTGGTVAPAPPANAPHTPAPPMNPPATPTPPATNPPANPVAGP
ncbi:MAG TPA: PDZ domain-containing protein, partial [Candidatus Dormibacteraeota bacterium]|nr:PDZ domain-containing protein [Candidatus Dormibacteraeota bacterium]